MAKKSRQENLNDARIERAYYARCSDGIQILMTDISKVYTEGRKLIADGATDDALGDGVRAFCERIRVDKPK